MNKWGLLIGVVMLAGCSSLSLSGTAKPTDNVGVTLGSVLTPNGIKNSGTLSVDLF